LSERGVQDLYGAQALKQLRSMLGSAEPRKEEQSPKTIAI
jgi:hypothetical protein